MREAIADGISDGEQVRHRLKADLIGDLRASGL